MAITWGDVIAIAPELSTVAVTTQNALLDIADRMIDDDVWGEFADDGRCYLAAHLATVSSSGSGSGAGAITSEAIGPLSRSYATPSNADGLGSTKYGQLYQVLLRLAVAIPAMVP